MTWRYTVEGTHRSAPLSSAEVTATLCSAAVARARVMTSSRSVSVMQRSSTLAWGNRAAVMVRICCRPRSIRSTARSLVSGASPCRRSVRVAVSRPASGLLISCATAAVMRPTAASRSAESARCSLAWRTDISASRRRTAPAMRPSSGSVT
ncbi:hypothetical protein FQZ97_1071980 [compost metagenome]